MELKTLLTADYLDIIFDQRNKGYGGYELRRKYSARLKKAAGIVLIFTSAIFTVSFISVNKGDKVVMRPDLTTTHITDVILPPPVVPKPNIVPPPSTPPTPIKTKIFTVPKIEVDNMVTPDKGMPKIDAIRDVQPGPGNTDDPDALTATAIVPGNEPGVIAPPINTPTIPKWVEQMPQFIGDMYLYMGNHLRYPDVARENKIQGSVFVSFVVNEDGTVSNATVVRGIGGGCDEEALRMVSGMPKWKPGKHNGVAVKVWFTIPIKFVLE